MSNLIDGKKFADGLCQKIALEVKKLKDKNIIPSCNEGENKSHDTISYGFYDEKNRGDH